MIMKADKPAVRASYEIEDLSRPTLQEVLSHRFKQQLS
jgi:hypothetical protein